MEILTDPFEVSFVFRALLAGSFTAVLCACVGTWVVLRGLSFFGDAMSHGMLPGVAVASLLGANLMLGAAVSAVVMSFGVVVVSRATRLSRDVSIGLQFIVMLSLGVAIVSHSGSFAVDLTSFLFGDVLGVGSTDVLTIGIAALVGIVACVVMYRPFTALTFDARKSQTLGLRPGFAHVAMLILVALATVASFQIVGTPAGLRAAHRSAGDGGAAGPGDRAGHGARRGAGCGPGVCRAAGQLVRGDGGGGDDHAARRSDVPRGLGGQGSGV